MNSEEFKDLGTLHYERRKDDYPPNPLEDAGNESARKQMNGTDSFFL